MPDQHTAANILEKLKIICSDYGLDLKKLIIVTDSASNMKCAFKENVWIPCMCHRLHTAVDSAWTESLDDIELKLVYRKMLEIRAHLHKSANKSSQLPKKLPNDSPTRPWCGLYQLFDAFDSSYQVISELIAGTKIRMPTDRQLIKDIGKFFKIFDKPFKVLQSTKTTTSYLVCIEAVKMVKKINELPERLEVLKTSALKCN